jgi:hypothetical protein
VPPQQCCRPPLCRLELIRTIPGGPLFGLATRTQCLRGAQPNKEGQKQCSEGALFALASPRHCFWHAILALRARGNVFDPPYPPLRNRKMVFGRLFWTLRRPRKVADARFFTNTSSRFTGSYEVIHRDCRFRPRQPVPGSRAVAYSRSSHQGSGAQSRALGANH